MPDFWPSFACIDVYMYSSLATNLHFTQCYQVLHKLWGQGLIKFIHEGVKPYECSLCDAIFTRKESVKKHFENVHNKVKPFKCVKCQSAFAYKNDLTKHVWAIHEGKKPFECKICEKTFTQSGSLKIHIKNSHERKRLFHCNIWRW